MPRCANFCKRRINHVLLYIQEDRHFAIKGSDDLASCYLDRTRLTGASCSPPHQPNSLTSIDNRTLDTSDRDPEFPDRQAQRGLLYTFCKGRHPSMMLTGRSSNAPFRFPSTPFCGSVWKRSGYSAQILHQPSVRQGSGDLDCS